jgi:hypothetical protein
VVRSGYLPRGTDESHGLPAPPVTGLRVEPDASRPRNRVRAQLTAESGSREATSTAMPVACSHGTDSALA